MSVLGFLSGVCVSFPQEKSCHTPGPCLPILGQLTSGVPEANLLGGAISHQLTTEAKQRRKDGGDFAEKPGGGGGGGREEPNRGCSKHPFVFNRAVKMSEQNPS